MTFAPPGPGFWQVDGLHTPKPISAIKAATYVQIPSGMKAGMARYGILNLGIELAIVNRFVYATPAFLVSRSPGDDAYARLRFDEQVEANPEIKERFARAEQMRATRAWRTDREHWDNVGRPWMMGVTLRLTDERPADMSDESLLHHINECQHHLANSMHYHHILNLVAGLPRSLLFYHTSEWLGVDPQELEPLMIGSSPISAGDEPELRALVDAVEKDQAVLKDVQSGGSKADLHEDLLVRQDEIGQRYREFVRVVGYRTLDGWEPMNPFILETPDLLVEKVQHGITRDYASLDDGFVARIRGQVPEAERARFDELLEDARGNSRIRDERDIYCNVPISGVLRRGVIEAGCRLAERGLVKDVEHITEATAEEIGDLLLQSRNDLQEELASRYDYRMRYSIDDVPAVIGTGPAPSPVDPNWLPGAAGLFTKALQRSQALMAAADQDSVDETETMIGRAVSPGIYEGTARVVREATEIETVKQGEILVTRSTNPAFNIIMPRLGALVTEYGGLLSHAAIVAREFGLPGIVGCKKVTQRVNTGDRLRVDGDTGELTIL
jgi:pyruvate,water dikinase